MERFLSTKPSLRRQDPELRVHEKEMSFFRPAASHCARLVCGLSAQLLFCISGRQPLFCLGAAGCNLLTAATSAFASAGVRGRHSPRLQSVSGRCTKRFRQVHGLQVPWLEGVGSPMQNDTRRGWKSQEGKCTGCSRQG